MGLLIRKVRFRRGVQPMGRMCPYTVPFNVPNTKHKARFFYGFLFMRHGKSENFEVIDEALGILGGQVLPQEKASAFSDVLDTDDELHAQGVASV